MEMIKKRRESKWEKSLKVRDLTTDTFFQSQCFHERKILFYQLLINESARNLIEKELKHKKIPELKYKMSNVYWNLNFH